jgi:hypothetical protein
MGQTKRLYEEMTLQELIMFPFNNQMEDDDYLYEEYKQQQMEQEEQERLAYEEMMGDRY